jgi:hypothetical protein
MYLVTAERYNISVDTLGLSYKIHCTKNAKPSYLNKASQLFLFGAVTFNSHSCSDPAQGQDIRTSWNLKLQHCVHKRVLHVCIPKHINSVHSFLILFRKNAMISTISYLKK